ncbi:MAG: hypothetical protein IJQ60_00915 [Prevotella sp.]|nr:hypothetical protein [Prevotella sp.]
MKGFYLLLLLSVALASCHSSSPSRSIQTINAEKAREVAREQVIWNDRVCPFSTLALDFLESVYGKSSYKGLMPEQVVYGWLLRPEVWKDEPMILIPDANLRRQLNIEGKYAKFSELFDDTLGYRLNNLGSDLPPEMRQLVRESAPVVELDEKAGMIILLTQGRLIQPRPDSIPPLSKLRVELEVLYNKISL